MICRKYFFARISLALFFVLSTITALPYPFHELRADDPTANDAPDLRLSELTAITLDGVPFSGSALNGKVVLLDFWAAWCAPCLVAMPTLNRLSRDFKDRNFEVIGIAAYSGTSQDIKKIIKRYDPIYNIVIGDPKLVQDFGVIGFPTYFLFGPDGQIVQKYVGEVRDLYDRIAADLERLLNQ